MTASNNPGHGTKGDIKGRESRLGATQSPRFPTLDSRPRRPILPFWQLLTRSRGGPATGRCGTRASEQAGKALRSQGHQCAHVM